MFSWLSKFKSANPQTQGFIFNAFVYGFVIIAALIYCYARLDFVRSGRPSTPTTHTPSYDK